jgi:hypothetical protein
MGAHAQRTGAGAEAGARTKAISALATGQHGVLSRKQLRTLGLSDGMIDSRLASGLLQPLFRGVFAFGHRAIERRGLMLAGVLACGGGSVVSHGSAAELLGLWDRQPVLVDVTSLTSSGRYVQGIRWHSGSWLASDEVTVHLGVPCTTVARTLVDMTGRLGEKSLRRLVEQAAVLRLLDVEEVDHLLARKRRRGAPTLRRILRPWRGRRTGLPRLRSILEARVFAASAEAGVSRPRCNVKLHLGEKEIEVDILWERQRLVVETDGEETHGTAAAFLEDRRRDQILTAAGYRVVRIAWSQLEDEPGATMRRIRRILEGGQG